MRTQLEQQKLYEEVYDSDNIDDIENDPNVQRAMMYRCGIQGHHMFESTITRGSTEHPLNPAEMKITKRCLFCDYSIKVMDSDDVKE